MTKTPEDRVVEEFTRTDESGTYFAKTSCAAEIVKLRAEVTALENNSEHYTKLHDELRTQLEAATKERDELKIFRWVRVENKQDAKQFYEFILPRIRDAAKECGYGIGLHGSMLRDLDLIAVPWADKFTDKDLLARKIHQAVCNIENQTYTWEKKPNGRVATAFPICFPEWNEPSAGHIDLSIIGTELSASRALAAKYRSVLEGLKEISEEVIRDHHALHGCEVCLPYHKVINALASDPTGESDLAVIRKAMAALEWHKGSWSGFEEKALVALTERFGDGK